MEPLSTSEHGVKTQSCENYHIYMVTLKPNWKSYVKKSIGNSEFMLSVLEIFMSYFGKDLKWIDGGIEYDQRNVCHIHMVLSSNNKMVNATELINSIRGVYIDFKLVPMSDLEKVIQYVNKGNKTDDVMNYYRTHYGFIEYN